MSKAPDLAERLLQFAVDVVLYLRTVKTSDETKDFKRQLIRCSASVGANYEESQGYISKPDSRLKIGIAVKEIRESHYFIKIFKRLELRDTKKCAELVKESYEPKLILTSIMNKLS